MTTYSQRIQKIRELLQQAHDIAYGIHEENFDVLFPQSDSEDGCRYSTVLADAGVSRVSIANKMHDINVVLQNATHRFTHVDAFRRAAYRVNRPVYHAFRVNKDFDTAEQVLAHAQKSFADSKEFASLESAMMWTSERKGVKSAANPEGEMWTYFLKYDPSTDSTTLVGKTKVS